MKLIPVLDLLGGKAVLAQQGKRQCYRPVRSPLCKNGDPLELVSGYLDRCRFDTLYIADLNRILRKEDNGIIIDAIQRRFPALTLWIDAGWPPARPGPGILPVVGSETLPSDAEDEPARWRHDWILSLDFDASGFRGPDWLLRRPEHWPPQVILMSLPQVGSGRGPDWARLEHFRRRFPQIRWIAAGGVRHQGDLDRLAALGVHAALVATALHQSALPGTTKAAIAGDDGS
ncbi:phosphoribosylformimino-5-aminoimidazole carboxamide ribotide isomerase [Methylomarinovum caldicuralii]|uniref:Phosphoribosylformimino-5-aminoimidazole carboxamide ribotide isomerase n=1 Tax=Methylomarinovum caldicuralii TaxID=438856 RepID=A0AAU9CPG5_9GAMM|nr:HisA/HisF-related TIM barrel protein [Methylomarinovum caldicuralii]BCX81863.1 phosphoribosylformimino-5-aminoimidazole carboxamide ribotide isomerase [Methylomarinovum caldicuralii]